MVHFLGLERILNSNKKIECRNSNNPISKYTLKQIILEMVLPTIHQKHNLTPNKSFPGIMKTKKKMI